MRYRANSSWKPLASFVLSTFNYGCTHDGFTWRVPVLASVLLVVSHSCCHPYLFFVLWGFLSVWLVQVLTCKSEILHLAREVCRILDCAWVFSLVTLPCPGSTMATALSKYPKQQLEHAKDTFSTCLFRATYCRERSSWTLSCGFFICTLCYSALASGEVVQFCLHQEHVSRTPL